MLKSFSIPIKTFILTPLKGQCIGSEAAKVLHSKHYIIGKMYILASYVHTK